MTTHIVYGDAHARPGMPNDRAVWLSKLIADVKPDVVINLGDNADMASLCSYEKGKSTFYGRTYIADIEANLDFEEKLWKPVKQKKKKMPRRVILRGNHEERIRRAIQVQSELEGTIGYKDLRSEDYYDDVVDYDGTTPGCITIDGVTYGHYFVSGVSSRPSNGSASLALSKSYGSITQGHSHVFDYSTRPTINGDRLNSLIAGCFIDSNLEWAGQSNKCWFRGCFIKRNVKEGNYDLEVVSMERLKNEYGH